FVPGKNILVIGSIKGVNTLDLGKGTQLQNMEKSDQLTGDCVAVSQDGKVIGSVGASLTQEKYGKPIAIIWQAQTRKQSLTFQPHDHSVDGITFAPNGLVFVTIGQKHRNGGGEARMWDVNTGKLLKTMTTDMETFPCAAFSPAGKTLALGSSADHVLIW